MADSFSAEDEKYMRMALDLARTGQGRVSPNPPVGCVLVRDGAVVGRGWHNRLGDLHAEAAALRDAGERARGATAYVTLSPCATHGRQPPCTEALLRAGVARVVASATDPNPKNTTGLDVLRAAGVDTRCGLLQAEGEYVARGFFKTMRAGLPWVTLKYAMTLDGRIATTTGDSRWVSCPQSREVVHDMRSRHDAVLVGAGTVRADDPRLTVRGVPFAARGQGHPQPARVAVCSTRLPGREAAIFGPGGRSIVACREDADAGALAGAAEVWSMPAADGGIAVRSLLERLAREGMQMIFCESGGTLAWSLLREGVVDEIVAFIAPKIVGGQGALGPVAGAGHPRMADAFGFEVRECIRTGDDIMLRCAKKMLA